MMTDCYPWSFATNNKGYGHLWVKGKYWLAHRYLYHITYGKIPKGKQVQHKCGNKLCIRPSHLKIGTQSDNEKDKIKHGTAKYYGQYAKRGYVNGKNVWIKKEER